MEPNNSTIIKENNAQFYYALLEFKERYEAEILVRYDITTRQSLSSMSAEEIKLISGFMVERALAGIK